MPLDHFGLIAGLYDRVGTFTLAEPLRSLLALSKDCRLLDAGGGTGRVSAVLRPLVKEAVVADVSAPMLRHAAEKGLPGVCAAAEDLPFRPESFERIIMVDAFHHVLDQARTVGELWRLLSPDGRLVIVEPDIRRFHVKLIALGEKLLLMRSHFMDGEGIAGLFAHPGARVRVVRDGASVIVLAERVRQM
jgi:ubiquinone/menaquinone biosynthesis C-methylase UbiE